jgi:hypothetical protein
MENTPCQRNWQWNPRLAKIRFRPTLPSIRSGVLAAPDQPRPQSVEALARHSPSPLLYCPLVHGNRFQPQLMRLDGMPMPSLLEKWMMDHALALLACVWISLRLFFRVWSLADPSSTTKKSHSPISLITDPFPVHFSPIRSNSVH